MINNNVPKYSKITAKKQVTLPDYVMDSIGAKSSDMVTFVVTEDNIVEIKKAPNLMDLAGSIKSTKEFTEEEADKSVEKYVVDEYIKKWNP